MGGKRCERFEKGDMIPNGGGGVEMGEGFDSGGE